MKTSSLLMIVPKKEKTTLLILLASNMRTILSTPFKNMSILQILMTLFLMMTTYSLSMLIIITLKKFTQAIPILE